MTVIVYVHGFIDIHTSVTDLVFKTTFAFTILKLKLEPATKCKHRVQICKHGELVLLPQTLLCTVNCNVFLLLSEQHA